MFKIVTTEEYINSLFNCADYIKRVLKNPDGAKHLLEKTERMANKLAVMPYRFPVSRYPSLAEKGIHVLSVDNYCIFYSIDDESQTVYLHAFGYAPRNWAEIL